MLRTDHESNVQHDETVYELRHRCRRRRTQPHMALTRDAPDSMEHGNVNQLT